MNVNERIKERVHELYWKDDFNCARTTLICLGELFDIDIAEQVLLSAIGLHGAGKYRAQCGIVEGTLLFIGIYLSQKNYEEIVIVSTCYGFAKAFEDRFGSLRCRELRPTGFRENDPPHMCEQITCEGIDFSYHYICDVGSI